MSSLANSVGGNAVGDAVALPPAHATASPSGAVSQVDEPTQLTTFAPFPRLPAELQDKIWEEAAKESGQKGINFIKLYNSVCPHGMSFAVHTRLDKYSKEAILAKVKRVCYNSKEAVERTVRVAAVRGEKFKTLNVNGRFGMTQVQLNVDEIVCFDMLHDNRRPQFDRSLPVVQGCFALRRSFFRPVITPYFRVNPQFSWIRRFAVAFPAGALEIQAMTMFDSLGALNDHSRLYCYYSMACNLTGLRNLEEVFFIVKGVPKPTEENPHKLLTKISNFLYSGPNYDWSDVLLRCAEFERGHESPDEADEQDVEPDPSLEVYQGSVHEYYQIRLSYRGIAGSAHHCLRHFARQFGRCDDLRVLNWGDPERVKDVKFKLMSYMG